MDSSTRQAVLAAVQEELARLWETWWRRQSWTWRRPRRGLRDGVLAIGAQLLEAAVAARGPGKAGPRRDLSLRGPGAVCALSTQAGADAGGLDHGAPRLLCLRGLRPRQLSAGWAVGAGAR